MRVLIVDDEEELVETLVERLELRQFHAEGFTEAQQALDRMQDTQFDVVLIDVKMPGMSGLEMLRRIKEQWPDYRVVLLTGHGSAEHAQEGIRLGAFAYVMKPIQLPELIEVLQGATGSRKDESIA
jgi:DNA-binding NtrC family response regulator